MSLLFNMLSRLVTAFLPRSKHLLISWLQSPSAVILELPKIKSVTVSTVSLSICHELVGPNAMIFVFWMCSQSYIFSRSHVWMWELDHKESWALKNWCFWTVVLEKTLESPLNCKEIKPVNPKGDQPWIFIGKTDAEAEGPILWPPDAKKWLIGKDPDVGKEWRQEEKGMTEVRVVGWHHRLDGHEFEQAPGVGDGQGSLALLQSMGSQRVRHDLPTELNWTTRYKSVHMFCFFLDQFR